MNASQAVSAKEPGRWAAWLIAVAVALFLLCKAGVLMQVFSAVLSFCAEQLVERGAGDFLIH